MTPHSNTCPVAPWGFGPLALALLWTYGVCPILALWSLHQAGISLELGAKLQVTFWASALGWLACLWGWWRQTPQLFVRAMGLWPLPSWSVMGLGTVLGLVALWVLGVVYGQVSTIWHLPNPTKLLPPVPFPAMGWMALIAAPIFEESVFRGALFTTFNRVMPPWASGLVSSALFALMHGGYRAYPLVLCYVLILGGVLCGVRLKTQSLWPCIVVHSLNNLLALCLIMGPT